MQEARGRIGKDTFRVDFPCLILKLCKCNNRQSFDNTKITAKQGNAEERPDAGCGIKRWRAAAEMQLLFILHWIFPRRINLGVWGRAPSAVRLQTCPQSKSQTADKQVPSPEQA